MRTPSYDDQLLMLACGRLSGAKSQKRPVEPCYPWGVDGMSPPRRFHKETWCEQALSCGRLDRSSRSARVSFSAQPRSTSWSSTRIVRPGIFIIKRAPSAPDMRLRTRAFFQAVAESVADAGAVLITGPANAKTELIKHIHRHDPKLMNAIAAVETVDHPSDAAPGRLCQEIFQGRRSDESANELNPRSARAAFAPRRNLGFNMTFFAASTWVIPVIIAITFHEAAHGFVARPARDEHAWRLGRVSFNPLKHIDPFGTIFAARIAALAAVAVPVRLCQAGSGQFQGAAHPRRDMIWVAVAGPGINLALATLAALAFHLVVYLPDTTSQWAALNLMNALVINVLLAVFNMLPLLRLTVAGWPSACYRIFLLAPLRSWSLGMLPHPHRSAFFLIPIFG